MTQLKTEVQVGKWEACTLSSHEQKDLTKGITKRDNQLLKRVPDIAYWARP
jgi:hypothetical protein